MTDERTADRIITVLLSTVFLWSGIALGFGSARKIYLRDAAYHKATDPLQAGEMVRHKLSGVRGQILKINGDGSAYVVWTDGSRMAECPTHPLIQWERE